MAFGDEQKRQNEQNKWYNKKWGTRWEITTPRNQFPREVRRLVVERSLTEALLIGRPVLGFTPTSNILVPGQRAVANSSGPAPTITTASDGAGLRYTRVRRSGGLAKERWYRRWGSMPFDHIVDPDQGMSRWGVIVQDLITATFDVGNSWLFFGLMSFNTPTDETSVIGAYWRTNNTDAYWTSGLADGTGTPSTVLHETAHASLTVDLAAAHRLAIWVDPATKSILWYANGVLVDAYTPTAPLAETTFCPAFWYYGITETGADASIYTFGGGNPRVVTLVPVD